MTCSIFAINHDTGPIGLDVQSHCFVVGRLVGSLESGLGGVATQAFLDVSYGPHGRDLLGAGASAGVVETVKRLGLATVASHSIACTGRQSVPALVVTGKMDACTKTGLARALRAEQVMTPALPHLPTVEAPQLLAELLERHLSVAENQ